jgi:large subunit ribosomal protein L6
VGFTHPVKFVIPNDITIKLESNTKITIFGIDKEKVGFFAAEIRSVRPPEPYKGKGILYEGEKIIRKAGKTGK